METATRAGSLAILRGRNLLADCSGQRQASHSATLLSNMKELLQRANHQLSEIELFAVAAGPGSFTGLRIGLATIKALAVTMKRASLGVPTLEAIARAAGASHATTVALLPAGRGELFAQMFEVEAEGTVRAQSEAAHLSPQRLLESLGQRARLRFAGEGAELYHELIEASARLRGFETSRESAGDSLAEHEFKEGLWTFAPQVENLATAVASLALERLQKGESGSPQELKAIYVRPSDAELNERCRAQNTEAM